MATKTLDARIVLKHGTYANWLASDLILKDGEAAVARIPANSTVEGITGPAVIFKMGDGVNTFANLPVATGLAGDVQAWAKAAVKPSYASTEISAEKTAGDGKTVETRLTAIETAQAGADVYRIEAGSGADANKWFLQKKSATADDSAYALVSTIDLVDILVAKQDNLGFEGDYNKTSNKVVTKSALDSAIQGLDADDAAVTGKYVSAVGVDANGQLDITRADLPDYSNTYAAKAYESKVDTMIGSDTGKSVRTIANEELAAQLIPQDAQESLDTLQEIAAWIQAHPGDASAMSAQIGKLKDALSHFVTVGQDGAYTVTTDAVKTYIDSAASNAVAALDVDNITGFGAGKTLATMTETDGKISATFQDIEIGLSQVTDAGTAAASDVAASIAVNDDDLATSGQVYSYVATALAALAAIASTGNVNDLVQTSGDELVIDCGSVDA